MRDDGEDFEYKGETCRVIGTGGDGSFGGLSVDAGIIGVIPVSLCDPQALKDTVPTDARLINNFATLKGMVGATLSLWMTTLSMAIIVNVVGMVAVPLKVNTICVPVIPAGLWLHPPVFTLQTMENTVPKIVPPKKNANNAALILFLVGAKHFAMIVHTIQFAVVPKMTLMIVKTSVPIVKTMTKKNEVTLLTRSAHLFLWEREA